MHYHPIFAPALLILVTLTGCGSALGSAAPDATATAADPSAQIVFVRSVDTANTELFVMDDAGNHLHQLTDTPLMEIDPTWSPHGTHLAVSAIRFETSGGYHVMRMRADGSERVDYTRGDASIEGVLPTWTPDGALTYVGEPDRRIWSLDPATAVAQPLTPQRPEGWTMPYPAPTVATEDQSAPDWSKIPTEYQDAFDWSPDGTSFVTTLFGNIVQVHADGTIIRWLTEPGGERDRHGWPEPGGDSKPVWSPDGTQIAFVREDRSRPADDDVAWPNDIFLMNVDGSHVRQLTTTRGSDGHPSWSPDGTRMVFSSQGGPVLSQTTSPLPSAAVAPPDQAHRLTEEHDIFVINVDGSGLTNLTTSPEHDMTPDWKP